MASKQILKPRSLKPGDTVAIVSPASPEAPAKFDATVDKLSELGFQPVEGKHSRSRCGYFAGNDKSRL